MIVVHLSTYQGLPQRRWARTSTQRAHCLPSVGVGGSHRIFYFCFITHPTPIPEH